ncbi:hypothetical protein [Paenibacillus sp. FJAT-26967]|uniref:hypothetical protein n=1 Tax=Paenibacillus sp. FJAT-26967 TaxID=1729690 RepID=UPI000837AF53|nr:hypothetical protein [Paenibacillus sp. FJAT-26967]
MVRFMTRIGNELIEMKTSSALLGEWLTDSFDRGFEDEGESVRLRLEIIEGYGVPFADFDVAAERTGSSVTYTRADYRIEADEEITAARVEVHDEFALKHALMNIYSAFLIRNELGLLVHSSCVVQAEEGYLFAGPSGAGKSTAALLSRPRMLLSDEATVIALPEGEPAALAHNSPFRSDSRWDIGESVPAAPLAGMYVLRQSGEVRTVPVKAADALPLVLNQVFVWTVGADETRTVMRLCRRFLERVPVHELYFQKNDSFWKVIAPHGAGEGAGGQ